MHNKKIVRKSNRPLNLYNVGGTIKQSFTNMGENFKGDNLVKGIGGTAGAAGAALAGFASNNQINDTSNTENAIESSKAAKVSATNNDQLMSEWSSFSPIENVSFRDIKQSGGQQFLNTLSGTMSGGGAGASMGPAGAIAGAGMGLLGGIAGIFTGNAKAKRKADSLNKEIDLVNTRNLLNLNTKASNIESQNDINALANFSAFGGKLNIQNRFGEGGNLNINTPNRSQHGGDFTNGVTVIGNGGSHEENPYEGVQIGVDEEGTPNLVEEGEVKFNDYVFSNRVFANKELLSRIGLPKSFNNHSYASIAEKLNKESSERPNDPISKNGLISSMSKLRAAQEYTKQEEEMGQGLKNNKVNKFETGGELDSENIKKRLDNINNSIPFTIIKNVSNSPLLSAYDIAESYYTAAKDPSIKNTINAALESTSLINTPVTKAISLAKDLNDAVDYSIENDPKKLKLREDYRGIRKDISELRSRMEEDIKKQREYLDNYNKSNKFENGGETDQSTIKTNSKPTTPFSMDNLYHTDLDSRRIDGNFVKLYNDPTNANAIYNIRKDKLVTPDTLYKDTNNTKHNTQDLSKLRYLPSIGSGINVLTDLAGLTNKEDYSNSDAIRRFTDTLPNVNFSPLSNYLTYNPLDRDYYLNKLNAQSGATRRALVNQAGGNRAAAVASLLSADYNTQGQMGNLARQSEEYNANQRERVEAFNRGTNQYNSEGAMKAAMANAQNNELRLKGVLTQAQLRDQENMRASLGRSTNLNNLFENIGSIGWEEYNKNMINTNKAELHTIDRSGNVAYKNEDNPEYFNPTQYDYTNPKRENRRQYKKNNKR